jgi:hypothetical protein
VLLAWGLQRTACASVAAEQPTLPDVHCLSLQQLAQQQTLLAVLLPAHPPAQMLVRQPAQLLQLQQV